MGEQVLSQPSRVWIWGSLPAHVVTGPAVLVPLWTWMGIFFSRDSQIWGHQDLLGGVVIIIIIIINSGLQGCFMGSCI